MAAFFALSTIALLVPISAQSQFNDAFAHKKINLEDIENDILRSEVSPYSQVEPLAEPSQHFQPSSKADKKPNSFLQHNRVLSLRPEDATQRKLFSPQQPSDVGKTSALVQPLETPYDRPQPERPAPYYQQLHEHPNTFSFHPQAGPVPQAQQYHVPAQQQFVTFSHDQPSSPGFPYPPAMHTQRDVRFQNLNVLPMNSPYKFEMPAVQTKYVPNPTQQAAMPAIVYGPPGFGELTYGSPDAKFKRPQFHESKQRFYAPTRDNMATSFNPPSTAPYPPSFIYITTTTEKPKANPMIDVPLIKPKQPATELTPPEFEFSPFDTNAAAPRPHSPPSDFKVQSLNAPSSNPMPSSSNPPKPDIFFNRSSKSLIDSYIPSWVVTELQKPTYYPQHFTFQNHATNAYDTVAYSVPSLPNDPNQHIN